MKIITRGEAMRIHQQHPASRLFPFCTGKYRWHGSTEAYTGREVQDSPGVLAGSAVLAFADGRVLALRAGDWTSLPARCRHRVESVSDDAVWLAVHCRADKA